MGRAIEWMMEMEQRGYGEVPEKMVCAELFREHRMIVDYIEDNGKKGECDYMHIQTEVVPLEDIVGIIAERFQDYYETPEEECAYESRSADEDWEGLGIHSENGYIIPNNRTILNTLEALQDLGVDLDNEELEEDIAACFNNDSWVLKDPYGMTEDEELNMVWDRFFDSVCKMKRSGVNDDEIYAEHAQLLDDVVGTVLSNKDDLVLQLPEGQPLFRCVYYKTEPDEVTASCIWAPPVDKASSQRMSREGQSRFYASLDMKTPQEEATNGDSRTLGLLGRFILKDRVEVLDLTNVPYRSFMDVHDYFAWCFLRQFADYIAQPVDEDEKYKYAPTQIVRDVFEKNISGIQGIMYKSCKCAGKKNVVMFWDDKTCGDYIKMESYQMIDNSHVNYCYMCGKELSEDGHGDTVRRHKEHIIHNGIYGRIKTSTILCEKCGGTYSKSDAKFVELFSGFMDLMNNQLYSKNHGENKRKRLHAYINLDEPNQKKVEYYEGKTSPFEPYYIADDINKEVRIFANKYRAKNYEKVFQKEHPEYAEYTMIHIDNMSAGKPIGLFFSENNPDFNRIFKEGIVKIATEFALDSGVDRVQMESLRVQEDSTCLFDSSLVSIFPYSPTTTAEELVAYAEDVIDPNYPSHILRLYVDENSTGRMLVCYVELFSTFRYYVILNRNYRGIEVGRDYAQRLVVSNDEDGNALVPEYTLKEALNVKRKNILRMLDEYSKKGKVSDLLIDKLMFDSLFCHGRYELGWEFEHEIKDMYDTKHYIKHVLNYGDNEYPAVLSALDMSAGNFIDRRERLTNYTNLKFNQLNRYCWNIDIFTKLKGIDEQSAKHI